MQPMQYSQSNKTSAKKERHQAELAHHAKKNSPDHSQIIIEDYRVANQVTKKNAAKSPSPKRVKVGRNTSPFVNQTHAKPIKTSKVTKTVSKHN